MKTSKKQEILTFSREETKGVPYRLRLARYQAIGETVNFFIKQNHDNSPQIKILDVGGDEGRILRHIEAYPSAKNVRCDLIDLFPKGQERVYKKEKRLLYTANFETEGLEIIPENSYDIVICEQVMEHLHNPELLATEINRILKKSGMAIIGVPSFPYGVHFLRKYAVPVFDKIFCQKKQRSHVQAFSLFTFTKLLNKTGKWRIHQKRGFRIVSGGILRKLESYRWWWRFNRSLGKIIPCMCIEIQIVATKD
ncbi:class I SAM-dependent methyltransferase [Candidatus Uabimicrobium sp. HlEnr_7]|uniref:class I SAM-dependent methyltransferase n=1 Tax=Candidatus Uabimicrobium helgolandensis TaxID=3095367 RepID=UPI0035567EB6